MSETPSQSDVPILYAAGIKPKSWHDMQSEHFTLMESRGYWTDYNLLRAKALVYDLSRFRRTGNVAEESKPALDGMIGQLLEEIRKTECG